MTDFIFPNQNNAPAPAQAEQPAQAAPQPPAGMVAQQAVAPGFATQAPPLMSAAASLMSAATPAATPAPAAPGLFDFLGGVSAAGLQSGSPKPLDGVYIFEITGAPTPDQGNPNRPGTGIKVVLKVVAEQSGSGSPVGFEFPRKYFGLEKPNSNGAKNFIREMLAALGVAPGEATDAHIAHMRTLAPDQFLGRRFVAKTTLSKTKPNPSGTTYDYVRFDNVTPFKG